MIVMEKTRVTKRERFERLIGIVENAAMSETEKEEMVEFLNHEIELATKKRAGLTKVQKANEELIEVIYNAIAEAEDKISATDIFEIVKNDEIKSPQKVSALVKKLVDAGRVARVEEKRKAYFTIAE